MYIGAHVVDATAWGKVKAGVYKGFSVKGPVTSRDPLDRKIVRGLKIYEISLVDRPSDPNAVFDVWRLADAASDDITHDAADAAMEDDMARKADKAQGGPDTAADTQTATVTDDVARAPEAEGAADAVTEVVEPEAATDAAPAAETPEAEGEATPPAAETDPVRAAVESAAQALRQADNTRDAIQRAVEGEVTATAPVIVIEGSEIRRSLSMVSRLGYVLSELTYIIYDADFEKEIEGDDSTVPAQLRDGLRTLATAYKAMSAEEVAELLKGVNVEMAVERGLIALGELPDDIARSAEFTVDDAQSARIQALFDGFVARGWSAAGVEAPAEGDEIARQVASLTEDRDTLLRTVGDLTGKIGELDATVTRMLDTAAPARTVGSLARAISKEEDAGGAGAETPKELSTEDVQRFLDGMPPEDRAMALTRAALANPVRITR
jgi:hypothetical protein